MIMPTALTAGMFRVLEEIKRDSTALFKWHDLMDLLVESKTLLFLQELGKVQKLSYDTPNYPIAQAVEASRANGVNQALDWLVYLRDILSTSAAIEKVDADFSGLDQALTNGDITKEEYDAIRNNQPIPDYTFAEPKFARPVVEKGDTGNNS